MDPNKTIAEKVLVSAIVFSRLIRKATKQGGGEGDSSVVSPVMGYKSSQEKWHRNIWRYCSPGFHLHVYFSIARRYVQRTGTSLLGLAEGPATESIQ